MKKLLFTTILISFLLIIGCSSDSPTTPVNIPPVINSITITSNPVPRNKTTSFSVSATDLNGDTLSYLWSVTSGTFSSGDNTPQVTWVPPTTIADYTVSLTVGDGESSIDTSFSVSVGKAIYNLSGKITNQSLNAISNVYVVISDSDSDLDSILTNATGDYLFTDKPEGIMSVTYHASTEILSGFPKVITKDTSFSFTSSNNVLNISLREFNTIYHDDGSQNVDWSLIGGVSNDGTKYIFTDEFLIADHMIMTNSHNIPANALDIHFLVRGNAGPAVSDSGLIRVTIYKNGEDSGHADGVYYYTPDYLWVSLESISNLAGSNIKLDLEFFTNVNAVTYPATTVTVDDIWIYNY